METITEDKDIQKYVFYFYNFFGKIKYEKNRGITMQEKEYNLKRWEEAVQNIQFHIPKNTSTSYYLKIIKKMIEQDALTKWDSRTITVEDETGTIEQDIYKIELFFGSRIGKVGLLFHIKTKRSDNGIEMDNTIETVSVKQGILSEREELSFLYNEQIHRYNYLREYDDNGICIYHYNKDQVKKITKSAKLYNKGIIISQYDMENKIGKSVLLKEDYSNERKKQVSDEIKRGKIFLEIDNEESIEIPYQPYPPSDLEFENILSKLEW